MKFILLVIIRVYWLLIPKALRRKCIFHKSCSNYVFEITEQEGLLKGLAALRFRIKNCNPYFDLFTIHGEKKMLLKSGIIVESKDIATHLYNENERYSITFNK